MITSSLFVRKLSIIESFLVVWNTSILMNVLSAVAIVDLLLLQLVVFIIHGHIGNSNSCLSVGSLVRQWLAPLFTEKHLKPSLSSNMDEETGKTQLCHIVMVNRSSKSGNQAAWNQRALPSEAEVS